MFTLLCFIPCPFWNENTKEELIIETQATYILFNYSIGWWICYFFVVHIFCDVCLNLQKRIQRIHLVEGRISAIQQFPPLLLLMELHHQCLTSSWKGMYSVLYALTNTNQYMIGCMVQLLHASNSSSALASLLHVNECTQSRNGVMNILLGHVVLLMQDMHSWNAIVGRVFSLIRSWVLLYITLLVHGFCCLRIFVVFSPLLLLCQECFPSTHVPTVSSCH